MKKIFKFALCAACFTAMVACNNNGGSSEVVSDKEAALKRAMTPYVENTVIATYRSMADEGLPVKLGVLCVSIGSKAKRSFTDLPLRIISTPISIHGLSISQQ